MGEVKRIEVDIMKAAAQMGLNSQRMLEYVFHRQPEQLDASYIPEQAAFESVDPVVNVSLQEPMNITVQDEPLNLI